jgi:short-subunit dehydrogenase
MNSSSRPLALVTGASAGIGLAYAERLAQDGWNLVITGRRRERLEELAQRLRSELDTHVETVAADLATPAGREAVTRLGRDHELELLVNNAGVAHYKRLLDLPEVELRELLDVNVTALTTLAYTAAQGMVARGKGAIVNLASLLGFSDAAALPFFPKRVIYASTKAYVIMFSRLLAEELEGTGVKVQVVCPGVVRTEFHSRQDIDMTNVPRMEAADVVQASLAALERGEVVCIPGLQDAGAVGRRDSAQAELLQAAGKPEMAERYRS